MNRFVNALLAIGFSLVLCRAGAADRFAFPQLPESPYVDTEISTNIPFASGEELSRRLSAKDDAGELGFSVSRGMFNPSWNLARITMRGSWGVSYEIHGGLFISPLTIRIR